MGRVVTKTPDTKLRDNTQRHVGQVHTLLYYATQNTVRALTYAAQGPARTLTGPTALHIIMPLTSLTPRSKPGLLMVKAKHTNLQDLFMFEEEGCVATFLTQGDLQDHMNTGRHVRVTERETVYDLARKEWAEKVTGMQ